MSVLSDTSSMFYERSTHLATN